MATEAATAGSNAGRRSKAARKPTSEETPPRLEGRSLAFEAWGIFALAAAGLLLLALVSFRPATPEAPIASNWIGPAGVFFADALYFSFGVGSFFFVFLAFAAGISLIIGRRLFADTGEALGYLLMVVAASALFDIARGDAIFFGHASGGWIGDVVGGAISTVAGRIGGTVLAVCALLVAFMLVTRLSVVGLIARAWAALRGRMDSTSASWDAHREARVAARLERRAAKQAAREQAAAAAVTTTAPDPAPVETASEAGRRPGRVRTTLIRMLGGHLPAHVDSEDDGTDTDVTTDHDASDDEPTPIPVRRPKVTKPAAASEAADDVDPTIVFDSDADAGDASFDDPPWAADLDDIAAVDDGGETDEPIIDIDVDDAPSRAATPSTPPPAPKQPPPKPDDDDGIGPLIVESEALKNRKRAADLELAQQTRLALDEAREWEYPPLSFLSYEESDGSHIDRDRLREQAADLEKALASFRVQGTVIGICPGPVVTRYEFQPESGTKLSKISNLSDDIAMALKAHKVRIIAPIPGKGCVGIEIPNDHREIVYAKEIIADERFARSRSKLTVALGKDIEGFPIVADLAKMPHLLVAGTTGSGKSVSVNTMITSILYNASPDDVRMIMIDPKQLEFAIYEDIPHLLLPVVTDAAKAATALQWAVQEMERRYKLMAELRVRNLTGYNKKLEELSERLEALDPDADLTDPMMELLRATDPDGRPSHRHMYYIVVIVDEFADLMMVAGKEVEMAVARLAQKARAAGIHVVLATQRPSVDVITGLIKANFPTRMSFRLMSGTDSRTVLDQHGAENLLGMGDMLYRPPGRSELVRVHGAYLDEAEIEKVCEFLKTQRKPVYDQTILAAQESDGDGFDDEPVDELYDQAVSAVIEAGFASISMVQRKLRIGYNRSARIVEQMEREGVIGPATGGSSRRDVLVGGAHIAP